MTSDFEDKTPTEPWSIAAAVRQEAKRGIKKLAPALVALLAGLLTLWSSRVSVATEEARSAAEAAEAKGVKGEQVAKTAKVETRAAYDATKEKVDATGDTLAELVARVKNLEEELERLKAAKAGRRPRRRSAVQVPPEVTAPLPPTPAAAAAQDASTPKE